MTSSVAGADRHQWRQAAGCATLKILTRGAKSLGPSTLASTVLRCGLTMSTYREWTEVRRTSAAGARPSHDNIVSAVALRCYRSIVSLYESPSKTGLFWQPLPFSISAGSSSAPPKPEAGQARRITCRFSRVMTKCSISRLSRSPLRDGPYPRSCGRQSPGKPAPTPTQERTRQARSRENGAGRQSCRP